MGNVLPRQFGLVPDYQSTAAVVDPSHIGGGIIVDGKYVADTVQCVHCGAQWEALLDDTTERGWCLSCNGFTCGHLSCEECLPFQRRLDAIERGKGLYEALRDQESRGRYL